MVVFRDHNYAQLVQTLSSHHGHGTHGDLEMKNILRQSRRRTLWESLDGHQQSDKNDEKPSQLSRVLLGIFSTQSQTDTLRRNLIRKSYLSTYTILNEVGLAEHNETTNRLCSLSDLIKNKKNSIEECLIVYTFVIGAWDSDNMTAPTDLTRTSDSSVPYTVDFAMKDNFEEDALYLNVRENMNDGKTNTWFRYASSIIPAEELRIDLIAKVDTDTVVFPKAFLEELDKELLAQHGIQRPATNVYGGLGEVTHPNETPYMQGGFYFLSRDVAQHITSDACPRDEIVDTITKPVLRSHNVGIDRSEDLEIGSFVERCWVSKLVKRKLQDASGSHTTTQRSRRIHKVFLNDHVSASHQPAWKKADRFRVMWKEGRARELAALRYRQIKDKYNNGCPETPHEWKEEHSWFDERPYVIQAKEHFLRIC